MGYIFLGGFIPFNKVLAIKYGFELLSRSPEIFFFKIFFSSPQLLIFPSICTIPFLQAFLFFLDLVVPLLPLCVVSRFLLLAWCIFRCQIPSLYPDCIFSLPFSFSAEFDVVHLHKVIDLFFRLT